MKKSRRNNSLTQSFSFLLKNIFLILFCVFAILFSFYAKASVNVGNFTELKNEVAKSNAKINITDNIYITEQLSTEAGVSIVGNKKFFDGGTIFGDDLAVDTKGVRGFYQTKEMTIDTATLQNFYYNFNNSDSSGGGAIYSASKLTITNSVFKNNRVEYFNGLSTTAAFAGALRLLSQTGLSSIDADFINNTAVSDHRALGGAVYFSGTVKLIKGDFTNNGVVNTISAADASTSLRDSVGGAIGTYGGFAKEIMGTFTANYAIGTDAAYAGGGALRVSGGGRMVVNNSTFVDNYASANTYYARGGAAYVHGSTSGAFYSIDSNYFDNYAKAITGTANGGAIAADSATAYVYLLAKEKDVLFSGNYTQTNNASKEYNAVFLENGASLYISAEADRSIIFNDSLTGGAGTNKVYIGNSISDPNADKYEGGGSVVFNDKVSNVTITQNNGSIVLGQSNAYIKDTCTADDNGCREITFNNAYLSSIFENVSLIASGGALNTINGVIQNTNLSSLTLTRNWSLEIDADLANSGSADTISADAFTDNNNKITISNVNIINDATTNIGKDPLDIAFTTDAKLIGKDIFELSTKTTSKLPTSAAVGNYLIDDGKINEGLLTFRFADLKTSAILNIATKNYNMTTSDDNSITSDEVLLGDLSINANNNSITGGGSIDIKDSSQTLNISNAKSFEVDIIGDGNVNITNSTISSSISGLISTDNTNIFSNAKLSGIINGDIENTQGTLSFKDATIRGDVGGNATFDFSGTSIINGNFVTSNEITNTGIVDINHAFTLNNKFNGGSADFSDKTITLSGEKADFVDTKLSATNGTINASGDGVYDYSLGKDSNFMDAKLALDINLDLPNGTATNDTFSGSFSGNFELSHINILDLKPTENVSGTSGSLDIFTDINSSATIKEGSFTVFENDYTLTFTTNTTDHHELDYVLVSAKNNDLITAITSIASPRQYTMSGNESAGLNSSLVGKIEIIGNGNTIDDGNVIMASGAELTLNNVNVAADINGNGAQININGASDYTFSGEINNAIVNVSADLNRTAKDSNVSYTINSGQLSYSNDAFLGGNSNSLTFDGGSLNVVNDVATKITLNNLELKSNVDLSLDVDLKQKEMDTFSPSVFSANGNFLNIINLNIISHGDDYETKVRFSDDSDIIKATSYNGSSSIETKALSPIYVYDVLYDDATSIFTFTREGGDSGFNPAAQTENVSKQTIYNSNVDFAKQMLATLDTYSPIQGRSTGDQADIGGAWFKVYASDEDVGLGAFTVDSKTYAGVLGVDARPEMYDNGIQGIYSLYLAYLQSEQSYDNVNIKQDGINFGARAMYDKGNWFGGIVANVGFNLVEGNNMYGDEHFETYTTSLSFKTGYDINIYCEEFVVQPSVMVSYLYGYTPDYKNSASVDIASDAIHAFNINPEIRFIAHLDNDISPYASFGYNWSLEEGGDVKANNIALPELSVDPFAEYKLGVTKEADAGLSGFVEVFATSGGREGYGVQAGLKWAF